MHTHTHTVMCLTHDRQSGSVALARLSAVLVFGDAAVGGQSVLLLHLRDVERPERRQEEAVTYTGEEGRGSECYHNLQVT